MAEAMGGSPNIFLTLTIRRNDHSNPYAAAKDLARAWRLCRLRLLRHFKWKKLPFLAVFEATKAGWPHLHILLRSRFIPQKLISHIMSELINSPVVGIEYVHDKRRTAAYVAKYVTKEATKFGTCKRYWQSADYDLRAEDPSISKRTLPGGWEIERLTLHKWEHNMKLLGWTVTRHSNCKYTAEKPP